MLSIKAEYNVARECFNQFIGLLKETNPTDNLIPTDLYRTKKLVSKLGLTYTKIDCCVNGCMLYFKEDIAEIICRHYNAPRFKPKSRNRRKQKDVPVSRMFYFSIIPRLQQIYASMRFAAHMRWHNDHIPQEGVITHPLEAEAWKYFDRTHPTFAAEPRNVRLGLCADGFTPFS
ncbi:hypothetical protein MA16_Dca025170 [Dendrobium catenatum]|uniref:Uncharacterized protein n=1 Tax=Dendrobium catenatum TaxID=906689 RepID=A0A2I0VIC8_9ASPA|nr:hypothetical protein MA16_Dca025170 [Dendrobium catenatum]